MGEGSHFVLTPKVDSDMTLRVCDLLEPDRGGWNVDLVKQVFHENEWDSILNIPLSRFRVPDRRFWWPSRDGIFSVKSCYWLGKLGHLRTWRL